MFELVWVFLAYAGKDLGCPFDVGIAVLAMLGEAGVSPFSGLRCAAVLSCSYVDATSGFTDIDGFRFTLALEFVDAFASAWGWLGLIAGAEST